MAKGKPRWTKFRHKVIRDLAYAVLYTYSKIRYGITIDRFKEQECRPYLILFNHQTAFDQFFVGCSFKGPVYYVASEDLFSNGFISSVIRYIVAPIPIKKQSTDLTAVMTCIRVAKEGGTIAMAPEGNRTYGGKTCYINPAVAGLARKLGLPIVLYKIEGGYGLHPRWSDKLRRGKMHSYISRVIDPEEYKSLSNEELLEAIEKELYVDEGRAGEEFFSEHRAEYLERAFYVCPFCGLSEFESEGGIVKCKKCGRKIIYGVNKALSGVDFDFPFKGTSEWYDYQEDFVRQLELSSLCDKAVYTESCDLYEVIPYKKKVALQKNVEICLFGDRITIGNESFEFSKVSAVAVLGRNKLNIYKDKKIYQVKSGKRFNALKYVNFCYRAKASERGEENGREFLGI